MMHKTERLKKLEKLELHITKELSLTHKEFHKLFPQFEEMIRKEELNTIGKRARLARFRIIGR